MMKHNAIDWMTKFGASHVSVVVCMFSSMSQLENLKNAKGIFENNQVMKEFLENTHASVTSLGIVNESAKNSARFSFFFKKSPSETTYFSCFIQSCMKEIRSCLHERKFDQVIGKFFREKWKNA